MSRVMIWGGTRGLGKEIAVHSLARGHQTSVTGRSPPDDRRVVGPRGVTWVHADFSTDNPMSEGGRDHLSRTAGILFWVSGHWLRKPFEQCSSDEIQKLVNVHLLVPMLRLRETFARRLAEGFAPPHLVVVSSSSAWKLRDDGQAAYGAVQAGKVQFARDLHAELLARFPEVRTTIVRPGGMKTDFFAGSGVDTSPFADPAEVAAAVWSRVELADRPPIVEMDIFQRDGRLVVDCTPHDPLCP